MGHNGVWVSCWKIFRVARRSPRPPLLRAKAE
jgi:hypothetical protein